MIMGVWYILDALKDLTRLEHAAYGENGHEGLEGRYSENEIMFEVRVRSRKAGGGGIRFAA